MKVKDLDESELRVYAHLLKLLSKSEMNDMCMRQYGTWQSVRKNVSQYGKIMVNIQQNKTFKSCDTKT